MVLCEKQKCTGCGLCKQVCGKQAISLKFDSLGFRIPVIDKDRCVNCGLCSKKCPELNPVPREKKNDCYLAWANDDKIHYNSASGGISYLLAKHVISHGGFVVGCIWDEAFNAVLEVIDNVDELRKTIGSKYAQSYISDKAWKEVVQRLGDGQKGVFFGLPCQVAAIKSYIKQNENLVLCEILCHGGSSPLLHKEHLNTIVEKKKLSDINDIRFRGGKYNFYYTLWTSEKIKYAKALYGDSYYYSFVKHELFHDSCYQCSYANAERISDITIGDFWGIDSEFIKDKNQLNGTNLVIIHNLKGEQLWNSVQEQIESYPRSFEEAKKGNDTLTHPTEKPLDRYDLLEKIKSVGFEKAISQDPEFQQHQRKVKQQERLVRLLNVIPDRIKRIIKTIFNIK